MKSDIRVLGGLIGFSLMVSIRLARFLDALIVFYEGI